MNTPTGKSWYYVDAQGQQQGPVSTAIVLGHCRQGRLGEDSLLWREGMPEWLPLSRLRAELGLPAAAPPPAPSPSTTSPSQASAASSPYAPPRASLDRLDYTAAGDAEVVPAGFLRRWAAIFLDNVIVVVAFYAVLMLLSVFLVAGLGTIGDIGKGGAADALLMGFGMMIYLLYFLIAGLYYALMESSANQATLGKMAAGIKVVDLHGRRLSFAHALGRWFAAALSYLTLWIGFFMAGFTERKRALHDFVASTQVVDRWAYTSQPERQQRGLTGCVIVFLVVVVGLGGIAMLGILAATAIPAYQDYVERARSRGAQLAPPAAGAPADTAARASLPGGGRLWLPQSS